MAEGAPLLTKRGVSVLRRLLVAVILSSLCLVGYWMLNQTLDAVTILNRDYVNIPYYPLPISVWPYHDAAFLLLWLSFLGFVLWDFVPWREGRLAGDRVVAVLTGFSLLTAGLWLAQDTMNAVLLMNRASVDYPFLLANLDVYGTRDVSILLVASGFICYFVLSKVAKHGAE